MKEYLELLRKIRNEGVTQQNRTGMPARSIFAPQLRIDLRNGFPLLTTKKMHTKSIIYELLWFLRGETNTRYLTEHGVTIWNEWTDEHGELGPVYGSQWRNWQTAEGKRIDQVTQLVDKINTAPLDRRLIVSAWNVGEIPKMALPPCHVIWQIYIVAEVMSLFLYMRSCDIFLGTPFNVACYAFLLEMLAHVCRTPEGKPYTAGELAITMVNAHLYENHLQQVELQLSREPRPLAKLHIKRQVPTILDFTFEDFELVGYNPWPAIKAEVAV